MITIDRYKKKRDNDNSDRYKKKGGNDNGNSNEYKKKRDDENDNREKNRKKRCNDNDGSNKYQKKMLIVVNARRRAIMIMITITPIQWHLQPPNNTVRRS